MSDWEFLYDMHYEGYSAEQIADAAACGYNPWEFTPLRDNEFQRLSAEDNPELAEIFENLIDCAMSYQQVTGRYLQIWGELGELYAEVEYGIKRHKPHAQGSDGRLGNDHIEIKTISPEKAGERVKVKSSGNFNKLLIVKITENWEFEGRFFARKDLSIGEGKHVNVSWSSHKDSGK